MLSKLTGKVTENLHSIFDMQRRKLTKLTKLTPKIHINKKNNILSRIVMNVQKLTYVLLNICNYCKYSVTDSVFCCKFSCKSYVSHVRNATTTPGATI